MAGTVVPPGFRAAFASPVPFQGTKKDLPLQGQTLLSACHLESVFPGANTPFADNAGNASDITCGFPLSLRLQGPIVRRRVLP